MLIRTTRSFNQLPSLRNASNASYTIRLSSTSTGTSNQASSSSSSNRSSPSIIPSTTRLHSPLKRQPETNAQGIPLKASTSHHQAVLGSHIRTANLDAIFKLLRLKERPFTPAQMAKVINLALRENRELELYQVLLDRRYPVWHRRFAKLRSVIRNSTDTETLEVYEFWDKGKDMAKDKDRRSSCLKLYSFEMLRQLTHKYVKLNDHEKATYFFSLLSERYAKDMKGEYVKDKTKMTTEFYESTGFYLVKMVNYENAVMILKFLSENDVKITGKLVSLVIAGLRAKNQYGAIFEILKAVPKLLAEEIEDMKLKEDLVREFLISLSYEVRDLKILLAYVVAVYPGSSFAILNDELRLLPLIYGDGDLRCQITEESRELVKAEIDSWFHFPSNTVIPMKTLTVIYTALYHHIKHHHRYQTANTLTSLHAHYLNHIYHTPELKDKADDRITNLLLNLSIRTLRAKKPSYQILHSYLTLFPTAPISHSSITQTFMHHGTSLRGAIYEQFLEWFERYDVPLTQHFCLAVLKKCCYQQEWDDAKVWFDKFEDCGGVVESRELQQLVERFGWGKQSHLQSQLEQSAEERSGRGEEDEQEIEEEFEDGDDEAFRERLSEVLKGISEVTVDGKKEECLVS